MTDTIRDAIFEHEMFDPTSGGTVYPLDHLRRVEATWNFTEAEILAELQRMTQDGLLYDDGGYWRASPEGQAQRERRWQEKSWRHSALVEQTADAKDLIIALVASSHEDVDYLERCAFHPDFLPVYLWKLAEDTIDEALRKLIDGNFVLRGDFFLIGQPRLSLTANGRIEYAKRVVPRLGLIPPNTILVPLETPKPTFSAIGLSLPHADNLAYRWEEAERCMAARAWLAATILYGSILESILLAILMNNKESAFRSAKAPKDQRAIEQWKLETMLNVAGDLELIDPALLKHGHALRDSRNLVHPGKQIQDRSSPDEHLTRISRLVVEGLIDRLAAGTDKTPAIAMLRQ